MVLEHKTNKASQRPGGLHELEAQKLDMNPEGTPDDGGGNLLYSLAYAKMKILRRCWDRERFWPSKGGKRTKAERAGVRAGVNHYMGRLGEAGMARVRVDRAG